MVAAHLLNYEWNPATDRPVETGSFEIDVALPEIWRSRRPIWLTPDAGVETVHPAVERAGDRVRVRIASFRVYGILAWTDDAEIDLKTAYAEAFRLGWRVALQRGLPSTWWRDLVSARERRDLGTLRRRVE